LLTLYGLSVVRFSFPGFYAAGFLTVKSAGRLQ